MYIDINSLIGRFGKDEVLQCNDPSATGVIDEAMLNTHIAQVQAEIDFYISQRYQTPLGNMIKGRATSLLDGQDGADHLAMTPLNNPPATSNNIPVIIVKIAGDITRARYFEGVATIPEEIARAAKEARRTLEQIASGKLNIEGLPISNAPSAKDNHVGFGASKQGQLSQSYRSHY